MCSSMTARADIPQQTATFATSHPGILFLPDTPSVSVLTPPPFFLITPSPSPHPEFLHLLLTPPPPLPPVSSPLKIHCFFRDLGVIAVIAWSFWLFEEKFGCLGRRLVICKRTSVFWKIVIGRCFLQEHGEHGGNEMPRPGFLLLLASLMSYLLISQIVSQG